MHKIIYSIFINCLLAILLTLSVSTLAIAASATISEETRSLKTYPFNEPNPIPILSRDSRLYPYHSFEGYSIEPTQQDWKVVRLENDYIEVFVLPEVGGKIWGARVKKTGHEFIYRNEVMKFRNIALRGPWTSGGIEFNFGIIGHTPATASPVDYVTRENKDGSVSVIVGTMDLPSRTNWRVEIRLPADKAYFETNVLWHNPGSLEQPYYNWMTAAAFAKDDLVMSIPGNASLTHPGEKVAWPVDEKGRDLANYDENQFGGSKSYHIVGEFNDFFGGYYHDDDYGFGHWSRYEEMPGQKLWLWALSRQGGIWEDLLTDTDGQYIEFQAGRMLNQYQPGDHINPLTKASFNPGALDRWTETWFPLEGIGGLSDASREGAMYVSMESGKLSVNINSFSDLIDTLNIYSGDELISSNRIELKTLEAQIFTFNVSDEKSYRVQIPGLDLDYSSDPDALALSKPYEADENARAMMPPADIDAFEGYELLKQRRYQMARQRFEAALKSEAWNRKALLGMADLEYRSAKYSEALEYANKALKIDLYDAEANFLAGTIYRALAQDNDARDAFGWAARSMKYRSVSYVELAKLQLRHENYREAGRYATLALDYDRYNLSALDILALIARLESTRLENKSAEVSSLHEQILIIDPLHHFAFAEKYLERKNEASAAAFLSTLRSEYPDQTILELAIDYLHRGRSEDAINLLSLPLDKNNPLLLAWRARLTNDPSLIAGAAEELDFTFPYRAETLSVLNWVAQQNDHWSWRYLKALNLWALDRSEEAHMIIDNLGDQSDHAPFYIVRAHLTEQSGKDARNDLLKAVELGRENRLIHVANIQYLQRMENWQAALDASGAAREIFPTDFNLDLLHVRSLNNLDQAKASVAILDDFNVLPSENARISHSLYAQAHTLMALIALDESDYDVALTHLKTAKKWPERLGQGRPYQANEQLQDYLINIVGARLGQGTPDGQTALKEELKARLNTQSGMERKLLERALQLR